MAETTEGLKRVPGGRPVAKAPHKAPRLGGDRLFAALLGTAALGVLALLGAILITLFVGGWPAFRHYGVGFLLLAEWDPVRQVFGALVPVFGTVASAVIALAIAVPVAFGIAVTLTELAPSWSRRPIGVAIELLAAVPSIIYGMWGFAVLVPLVARFIQPALHGMTRGWPLFGSLFGGPAFGTGLFTAALVLAVMVIPFIAATMRDVFLTVPPMLKESAYGLGCTGWEVTRRITLPHTRASVIGGIMLGLGRALGETMAVTFVIGNTNRLSASIFGPGNTIASLVALEFPESPAGSLRLSSLLALGFVLFGISFVVLAASRLLLRPRVMA